MQTPLLPTELKIFNPCTLYNSVLHSEIQIAAQVGMITRAGQKHTITQSGHVVLIDTILLGMHSTQEFCRP